MAAKVMNEDILAEAVGMAISTIVREGEARCAALEAQIASLRTEMLQFRSGPLPQDSQGGHEQ